MVWAVFLSDHTFCSSSFVCLTLLRSTLRALVTVLAISLLFPCYNTWPPLSFMRRGKAILRCPVLLRKSWHLVQKTTHSLRWRKLQLLQSWQKAVWKGSVSFPTPTAYKCINQTSLIIHNLNQHKADLILLLNLWLKTCPKKPKPPASVSLIITGDLIITGNFDM